MKQASKRQAGHTIKSGTGPFASWCGVQVKDGHALAPGAPNPRPECPACYAARQGLATSQRATRYTAVCA